MVYPHIGRRTPLIMFRFSFDAGQLGGISMDGLEKVSQRALTGGDRLGNKQHPGIHRFGLATDTVEMMGS